jgi:hypothetical protein
MPTTKPNIILPSRAVSDCLPDFYKVLQDALGSDSRLLRTALQAHGLVERLEVWERRVTFFAPTDKALYKWMNAWGLTEQDILTPSFIADDCMHLLFKNLAHASEQKTVDLLRWVDLNEGGFELPTLCGEHCGPGLVITSNGTKAGLTIGGASLHTGDLNWCNGAIHIINDVPVWAGWSPHGSQCKVVAAVPLKPFVPELSTTTHTPDNAEVAEVPSIEEVISWIGFGGIGIAFISACAACIYYTLYVRSLTQKRSKVHPALEEHSENLNADMAVAIGFPVKSRPSPS